MSFWTVDAVRAACGGTFVTRGRPAQGGAPLAGVSIDSRAIKPGQVFIAIRGETFDGHDFVHSAIAAGAAVVIIDREIAVTDESKPPAGARDEQVCIIRVADTRKALLRLAGAYRNALEHTKVIAVCGSNGKTTTTRLVHAVLSARLRGTCPAKSFNNDIGVPLTILSAKESDQYLICEVGSNAPGEIAALGGVVSPDLAVITSIGREHLQGFGSLEGVAREEAAILGALRSPGAAIVTADSPLLSEALRAAAAAGRTCITFGAADHADLRLTAFEHVCADPDARAEAGSSVVPDCIRFGVNGRAQFVAPLVGEHNALNALAAIAVGRRFGLSDPEIAAGLLKAVAPDMRLQRLTLAGIEVINDAYNANPESTLAALRTFASLHAKDPRRVVILGDNLELGAAAEASHRELGRAVASLGCVDLFVAVGPLMACAAEEAAAQGLRVHTLPDLDSGRDRAAAGLLRRGDSVLIKASRGMGLERIVQALRTVSPVVARVEAAQTPRTL